MRYFKRIRVGVNVGPVCHALAANAHLWDEITMRQDHPESPHRDTQCIWVRGPASLDIGSMFTDLVAHDYPAATTLRPEITELINPLLREIGATELGRVMIVRLRAGGHIARHWDSGDYAAHYSRFHLCLISGEGNRFECGDEAVHMLPGELWWFDHRAEHSVRNDSDHGRVHIIIDAVTPQYPVRKD